MSEWDRSDYSKSVIYFLTGIAGLISASLAISPTAQIVALIFVAFVAILMAFDRPILALYAIVILTTWSPEYGRAPAISGEGQITINAANVGNIAMTGLGQEARRDVTLRIEDFLILVMALSSFARFLVGSGKITIPTPINGPLMLFIAVSCIATTLGVINGTVQPKSGFFFNLKYIEYYLLFFLTLAYVRNHRQIRTIIFLFIGSFIAAIIYGYAQIGMVGRVAAPFDVPPEPNTFGGYIMLMCCICGGIALSSKKTSTIIILTVTPLLSLLPFLYTKSRASYMALLVAYLAFCWSSPKRWLFLLIGAVGASLFIGGIYSLPEEISERIGGTFIGSEASWNAKVTIMGIELDPSSSERILSYLRATEAWAKNPLIGQGITGVFFIDGYYVRILAETGLAGLSIFIFLLYRIIKTLRFYRTLPIHPLLHGLVNGMYCAVFGLMAHCITANTFMIIRIAEPFWILLALAMLVPYQYVRHHPAQNFEAYPSNPTRMALPPI